MPDPKRWGTNQTVKGLAARPAPSMTVRNRARVWCRAIPSGRVTEIPPLTSNDPPAEPEAFRLLAPQRGLIATDQ